MSEDGELRKAIRKLLFWGVDAGVDTARQVADAVLALPEVAALRAKAAAADRVRELADELSRHHAGWDTEIAAMLVRALDGPA